MSNTVTISSSDSEPDEYEFLSKAGKIFEKNYPEFNIDDSDIVADTVDLNSSCSSTDDDHKASKCHRSTKTRPKRKKPASPNKKRTTDLKNSADSSPCSTPNKKLRNGHKSADSSDSELNLTPISLPKAASGHSKVSLDPFLHNNKEDENDVMEIGTPIRNEVILPIKLKVRYHGKVERFEVDKDAPMSEVYEQAAKRFNIPEDRLTVHKDGQVVLRNATPQSLSLNITHILDCYQMEDSVATANAEEENTAQNSIQLKVQSKDRKSTELITIRKTDVMHILMSQYAALKNLPLDSLKFRFDGDLLSSDDTPHDLDMEGGEVIDVLH